VVGLTLIALLAAIGAPRFFSRADFSERVFVSEVRSAVRHAQKLAVRTGCGVQLDVAAGAYALTWQNGCAGSTYTLAVRHPGTGAASYGGSAPGGISLAAAPNPFRFDGLGRATDTSGSVSDVVVSVGGDAISVVGETGYVSTP
jgi:MSHA pilin protein MshC